MMASMYALAKKHFKKGDPRLYKAALEIEMEEIPPSKNLFRDIVWTIVGQQLSARAADAIFSRVEALTHGEVLTPERLLTLSFEQLRACGLSAAKVRAIKVFATAVHNAELDLVVLPQRSDEEVVASLTRLKGIGPWTAEMILMFSLGRPDVFSRGDLGLRKGVVQLYGLRKPPSERRLLALLAAWSPYRTYAARILWKIADKKTARIGRKRATSA